MDKITYEDFHGKVLFKTPKYNDYFKENFRVFDALEFIALITAHIPPKHKQLIRRYGLYASRTRGKWETQDHLVKIGWSQTTFAARHASGAGHHQIGILIFQIE